MPLRFDLGPFEELHIGKCVIKNSHERSLFSVEGEMPILKGKDTLSEASLRKALKILKKLIRADAFIPNNSPRTNYVLRINDYTTR